MFKPSDPSQANYHYIIKIIQLLFPLISEIILSFPRLQPNRLNLNIAFTDLLKKTNTLPF